MMFREPRLRASRTPKRLRNTTEVAMVQALVRLVAEGKVHVTMYAPEAFDVTPAVAAPKTKYPWQTVEVGQGFPVEGTAEQAEVLCQKALKLFGKRFRVKVINGVVGVVRAADPTEGPDDTYR